MFTHLPMRFAGGRRRALVFCIRRLVVPAVLLACGLALQACSNPPPSPYAGADPSEPDARAPAARYHPVVAPYASRRPVEPKPWLGQNESVAPRKP